MPGKALCCCVVLKPLANPFYMLLPDWALFPMIGLATAAAVIASQAVITGVFSMVNQAIQLRYLPRLSVKHTSALERGQIYLPLINWMLFISVLILILLFENSAQSSQCLWRRGDHDHALRHHFDLDSGLWLLALAGLESSFICCAIPGTGFSLCGLNVLENCFGWRGADFDRRGTVYDSHDLERWACVGTEPAGTGCLAD